jgi:DNA-binding transcriptional LysR family regulator
MFDLRHLRYFIAVAEELNLHRAADRVHVDPSPLSRTVKELEEQLGVLLFARTPRTLRLTPAGEKLLLDAREMLIRLEQTKRAVRETGQNHRASLRIGIADGLSQPKLSRCLSEWFQIAPHTPIQLQDMLAPALAGALRREELDVGISFGVSDEDAIIQEPAWNYPLMAVVPLNHVLATRPSLSLDEVVAYPMIVCSDQYKPGVRRQVDALIKRYSLEPVIAGEAGSLAGYLTQIGAGLGVGFADTGHMQTMRREDVVSIPLEDSALTITTHVLHKRQRSELPTSVKHFLTHAKSM